MCNASACPFAQRCSVLSTAKVGSSSPSNQTQTTHVATSILLHQIPGMTQVTMAGMHPSLTSTCFLPHHCLQRAQVALLNRRPPPIHNHRRNLVQRKVDRAAKAREATLKIRQQACQTGSVAAHAQAQWPFEIRQSVARQLLWQPTFSSLRVLSCTLHVDRRLLSQMIVIAASLLLDEQENAFNTFVRCPDRC